MRAERFTEVPALSPQDNMRLDEECFCGLEGGKGRPLFRIYRWNRLCVSIGRFQEPPQGIEWVRRPTGGGVLLHGWDISFSLVDFKERWGSSPKGVYLSFSKRLSDILKTLGTEAKVEEFGGRYDRQALCFFTPSVGEIRVGSRKLVALAMRTGKRAFLIQGSVYEDFDYERASELLGVDEVLLKSRITSLREVGLDKEKFLKKLWQTLEESVQSS